MGLMKKRLYCPLICQARLLFRSVSELLPSNHDMSVKTGIFYECVALPLILDVSQICQTSFENLNCSDYNVIFSINFSINRNVNVYDYISRNLNRPIYLSDMN